MNYLSYFLTHFAHVSISATILVIVTIIGIEDAPPLESAKIARSAVDQFATLLEDRRLTGQLLNTQLNQPDSPAELASAKDDFDRAFRAQQVQVLTVYRRAAHFALEFQSPEYKTFQFLYETRLSACMLIPMRRNLVRRYGCSAPGPRPGCEAMDSQLPLGTKDCGIESASFGKVNATARNCIQTLTIVLDRAVDAKSRFLGIFGRLNYAWRAMWGQETSVTPDGRSWKAALEEAATRDCVFK